GKLVALLGVHDLIVVEQGGAILVADKSRAQDIKLIVEQVKKQRPELA
ncbi:MAG: mannose-1-phosphate guanylyltransferase, partial [Bdellovibrionota bacterium]